jgi:hypothetical protein
VFSPNGLNGPCVQLLVTKWVTRHAIELSLLGGMAFSSSSSCSSFFFFFFLLFFFSYLYCFSLCSR